MPTELGEDERSVCRDCGERFTEGCSISECNYCAVCCTCCSLCERGETRCTCLRCGHCEETTRRGDVCLECLRCEECVCTCEEEDMLGEFEAKEPFPHLKSRMVGLEIEYNHLTASAPLERAIRTWRAGHHQDGSCGWEVVTAPLAGPNIGACLKDLASAFEACETKADEKCGVHVHVDAKDLSWPDIFRLLWVYARVEPLLYVIAGQQRIGNTYCKPAGAKYLEAMGYVDRKGGVLATAYDQIGSKKIGKSESGREYVRSIKPGKKDGGRYKGLNIIPWLAGRRENINNTKSRVAVAYKLDRNGTRIATAWVDRETHKPIVSKPVKNDTTVEFRIHRNTLDGERLTQWALLCMRLVDWCAKATDKEAQSLPRSALRCLAVISPESLPFMLKRIVAWRYATRKSLTNPIPRRIHCHGGRWKIVADS